MCVRPGAISGDRKRLDWWLVSGSDNVINCQEIPFANCGPTETLFACLNWFFFFFFFFASHRHSLFGRNSVKTIEADLGRLYTATSLMQIDDNIMRFVQDVLSLVLTFTSGRIWWSKSFKEAQPCFLLSFFRKFHGHNSLKEYYEKESCVHYIHNVSNPAPYYYNFFSLLLRMCSSRGFWFSRWRCHSCWWTLQMILWFTPRCLPSLAR